MERVLTREDVELPRQQLRPTTSTFFVRIDHDKPLIELGNVGLDRIRRPRRVAHVALEPLDVRGVAFEGVADLVFEVVDDYEVGEEGEDVFNLEKRGRLEEAHGAVGRKERGGRDEHRLD